MYTTVCIYTFILRFDWTESQFTAVQLVFRSYLSAILRPLLSLVLSGFNSWILTYILVASIFCTPPYAYCCESCFVVNVEEFFVISGSCRRVNEICALWGFYASYNGSLLPTFRDDLLVPYSRSRRNIKDLYLVLDFLFTVL